MLIPPALVPRVKVMQIIAAAIMMGLAVFVVIANFVGRDGAAPPGGAAPVVTYLGLFLLAGALPAAFLLPAAVTRGAVRSIALQTAQGPAGTDDEALVGRLLNVRQTAMILSLAVLEGAGFLNAIAFLVEREPLALGGALGALALMATRFPTFAGVAAWLQQQMEAVAALRQRPEGGP